MSELTIPEDATARERDCFKIAAMIQRVDEDSGRSNTLVLVLASLLTNYELELGHLPAEAVNKRSIQTIFNELPTLQRLVSSTVKAVVVRNTPVIPEAPVVEDPEI